MRKPSTEELSLVHEELFKLATEALQRGDEPSLPSWLQLAIERALGGGDAPLHATASPLRGRSAAAELSWKLAGGSTLRSAHP